MMVLNTTIEDGLLVLGLEQRLLLILLSALYFCVQFQVSWRFIFPKFIIGPKFSKWRYIDQVECGCRVNGCLHAAIIVTGVTRELFFSDVGRAGRIQWDPVTWEPRPGSDISWLQVLLCLNVGYFAMQTLLDVYYQVKDWSMYLVHHSAAAIPYMVYLLAAPTSESSTTDSSVLAKWLPTSFGCKYGVYVLGLFLLVEWTNWTINLQFVMQHKRMSATRIYSAVLGVTTASWILVRCIVPGIALSGLFTVVLPHLMEHNKGDYGPLIPSIFCAVLIAVFCWLGLFLFVLQEHRDRARGITEGIPGRSTHPLHSR